MRQEPTHRSEGHDGHDGHRIREIHFESVLAPPRQQAADAPLLVTVEEAARRLSIGRTAAYLLVLRGELQSVKIGRARRVVVASLEAYIQRLLDDA
jgi:excisionase family DNA binding protein